MWKIRRDSDSLIKFSRYVAKQDKLTMLKFILSKGNACYTVREYVNYFARKSRKTWLMIAVDNGNINIVNNLINFYGADVNQANGERLTPLHIAAYKGHRNIALLLLKNGADRLMENKWGEKPAETARGKGNEELAQLMKNIMKKHGSILVQHFIWRQ